MLSPLTGLEVQRPRVLDAAELDSPAAKGVPYSVAEPGLGSLTELLWKKKWLIVAMAAAGAIAGLAVALLTVPVYRAHTSIQVEGFNDTGPSDITFVSPLPNASPDDYVKNAVKVLESDTLARRVARQLDLNPTAPHGTIAGFIGWLRHFVSPGLVATVSGPQRADAIRVQTVQTALSIRTSLQSQVIDVYFDARTPELAARGANAAATQFIDLNREARFQLIQDTTEWLNKQAGSLKEKLYGLNRQLQHFINGSGLTLAGTTPAQDRLRQLQDAYTRAEADRAGKQARYLAALSDHSDVMTDTAASNPLRQYETDLQKMRRQLADLRTIYTPQNYRITRLAAQIAATENAIQKERQALIEHMRTEYTAAESLQRTLAGALAQQLTTVNLQTQKQLQFDVLRNEVDTTQKLYDAVLERAKDAGAASSLRITNIRIIDAATAPILPYSPNLPLNIALGFGLGTVMAAGLVLMRTRQGKVMRPGELRTLNLRELGAVPSVSKQIAVPLRDTAPSSWRERRETSLLRESFRAVLTSLLFATQPRDSSDGPPEAQPGRILAITSLEMMEGKTTIVSNLGVACAQQKRDVLLIDADFRRPSLHQQFGLANTSGFSDILRGSCSDDLSAPSKLRSFVQRTRMDHLSVLTAGDADESTADLIYSGQLNWLLRMLARQFELVLIDTPPLSMYSDARVLGRASDGVVLVVRANTKSYEELTMLNQNLMQDGVRTFGTILNDWKIDRAHARTYARYQRHYGPNGQKV